MRTVGLAIGGLMVVVGIVWVLQGLGYLAGSSMTGDATWAVIGTVVGVAGIALGIWSARRSPPPLD